MSCFAACLQIKSLSVSKNIDKELKGISSDFSRSYFIY